MSNKNRCRRRLILFLFFNIKLHSKLDADSLVEVFLRLKRTWVRCRSKNTETGGDALVLEEVTSSLILQVPSAPQLAPPPALTAHFPLQLPSHQLLLQP